MKFYPHTILLVLMSFAIQAQTFIRSQLPTQLSNPWEITYGPDNFLWITETGGKVSRVDPTNGNKTVIYTAPDYFGGSPLENLPVCHQPAIQAGTLGLALHPDFSDSSTAYIYFIYSYNSGTAPAPATMFRIKRLTWDATSNTVVSDSNVVNMLTTGYDHIGGRLLSIKQNNIPYLFVSIGDHGISEDNSPTCYTPQSNNPNNFAQDATTQNGKIHRFNMDGSIPSDNPITGNSFYTRGHRNPQGLMYNPTLDILYDIEHGDRTDDEINILHKGMNYGWKDVRGYHSDNNHPGEAAYISSYTPNPSIINDSLVEAFYSWCTGPADTSNSYADWCTVAPSDGIYYGSSAIPEWTNSLLVVTLKDGASTDRELYQFKLQANGELAPSTPSNPNPKKFFGDDQSVNGRLRDVCYSPDGRTIYLINNGGASNKISVYTYDSSAVAVNDIPSDITSVKLYPNPVSNILTIEGVDQSLDIQKIKIRSINGSLVYNEEQKHKHINVSNLARGVYFISIICEERSYTLKFIKT